MDFLFLKRNLSSDDDDDDRPLTTSSLIAFIFAFIVQELYFISQIYFIFKYNKKFIEKKHIPYLQIFLNLLNTSTYVVIAIKGTGDFQNLVTNGIGLGLCLIVVLQLYLSLSKKKNSNPNYIFNFFFIFNIIFQIYYFIFKYKEGASKYITIVINILMYLSLNIGTYYAFKEGKPDRIPILSAVLGLLSSTGWTIYAACLDGSPDNITLFSNLISILVLVFTIACYIYLIKCHKPEKIVNTDTDIKINASTKSKEMTTNIETTENHEGDDSQDL